MKFLAGFVTPVLLLGLAAGCSSSDDTTTPSPTVVTTAGSGSAGGIAAPACSLASSDQVKELLGSNVDGVEQDFKAYYKACNWKVGDKTALNASVIRLGNGQLGFYDKATGYTATQIKGLGDKATYLVGTTDSGAKLHIMVTNKGSISLSMTVTNPTGDASKLQDQLTEVAGDALTKLGA